MQFIIKKNSTLPLLKLTVVKDGRSDYNNFMDFIEESAIFFSMVDVETGIPKIVSRPAGFVKKEFMDPNTPVEYYVYYQFTSKDTKKVGRFEGQFLFRNNDGTLILPIRDKLYIDIQESFIADDLPYESCYVSEFPCCVSTPVNPVTTTTTTQQPLFEVTVETIITPGSIMFDFIVTIPSTLPIDYELTLSRTFNVSYGDPIVITTDVTIPAGELTTTKRIILDEDFNRITYGSEVTDVTHNTILDGYVVVETINDEVFAVEPTPTPTNTPTPTPTPTPTSSLPVGVTPTPTSTATATPTPTPTNTTTATPTPTPTTSPVTQPKEILFGKSKKQIISGGDYLSFTKIETETVINKHYEFPDTQGYCYYMIPSYMDQPNIFRNSNDGCDGFIVPFIRIEDQEIVDSQGNIIIYYVYRSFVSTFASVDIWVCD
jgi:hypothetical protein